MTGLLGAVLAGGRSSRFGSDKSLALWQGLPLLDHAVALLEPHCDQVILCGRTAPARLSVNDRPAPYLGPLGGLNAALHFARDAGYRRVVTIGCDTPDLPSALFAALLGADCAHVLDSQPIISCWPVDLADWLERFVNEHPTRSMRAWVKACRAVSLDAGDVANINFREDLDALVRRPVA